MKRVFGILWRVPPLLFTVGFAYGAIFPLSLPELSTLDQPPIRQKPNGHYVFQQPWSFEVDGKTYEIPVDYLSNGITAGPRLKKFLGGNSVESTSTRAAIIHDFFILRTEVDRFELDRIFYAALRQGDTPVWKAKLMYHCVTLRSMRNRLKGYRHPGKNSPAWGKK